MQLEEIQRRLRARADVQVGAPASASMIAEAEHRLGAGFPPTLQRCLETFGWLSVGHCERFGLGTDVSSHLDLVDTTLWERESGCPLPVDLVPLMNNGGRDLHCIGASPSKYEGRIVAWYHEDGSQQSPSLLADDLWEWLGELIESLEADPK